MRKAKVLHRKKTTNSTVASVNVYLASIDSFVRRNCLQITANRSEQINTLHCDLSLINCDGVAQDHTNACPTSNQLQPAENNN